MEFDTQKPVWQLAFKTIYVDSRGFARTKAFKELWSAFVRPNETQIKAHFDYLTDGQNTNLRVVDLDIQALPLSRSYSHIAVEI